jgi:hypothetical protein
LGVVLELVGETPATMEHQEALVQDKEHHQVPRRQDQVLELNLVVLQVALEIQVHLQVLAVPEENLEAAAVQLTRVAQGQPRFLVVEARELHLALLGLQQFMLAVVLEDQEVRPELLPHLHLQHLEALAAKGLPVVLVLQILAAAAAAVDTMGLFFTLAALAVQA